MSGAGFDDDLYRTFFLGQAVDGEVTSIRLDEGTNVRFARRHGADDIVALLARRMEGERGSARRRIKWCLDDPHYGHDAGYVALSLLVVCQAQWLLDDADASHDIRRKLLELFWLGSSLNGLPSLWRKIGGRLRGDGVTLTLPAVPPSRRLVGVHQALVFPLHVHRHAIREVVRALPEERRTNAVLSMRLRAIHDARGAMRGHLDDWKALALRMDPRAFETPFWRTVEEERNHLATRSTLVVRPTDDFPSRLALYERSPSGEETERPEPSAMTSPSVAVGQGRRQGRIGMTAIGFGRYVEVDRDRDPDMVLERVVSEDDATIGRPVGNGWWRLVAAAKNRGVADRAGPGVPLERKDGIRVGRRLLHRYPFVPWHRAKGGHVRFRAMGEELAVETDAEGYRRPTAPRMDGEIELEVVVGTHVVRPTVAAAGRAERHPTERLREFRAGDVQHDDGTLRETAPRVTGPLPEPPIGASSTDPSLLALGEALYARSARGLGLGEAVELARRVFPSHPERCWGLLRAFVDAGWYDPVWRHGTVAQALFPRRLRLVRRGGDLVVDGILCEEVVEGLRTVAERLGGALQTIHAQDTIAPPSHVLHGLSEDRRAALSEDTGTAIVEPSWEAPPPVASLSDDPDVSRYEAPRRQFGVGRLDRKDGKGPPLWSAGGDGKTDVHVARTAAQLHAAELAGRTMFTWAGGLLWTEGPGRHLPASWARWLRHRALQGGGVAPSADGTMERYAYPCDRAAAEALSSVCPVVAGLEPSTPAWIVRASRAGNGRRIGVGGRIWRIR